jgi:hypothetical protein
MTVMLFVIAPCTIGKFLHPTDVCACLLLFLLCSEVNKPLG